MLRSLLALGEPLREGVLQRLVGSCRSGLAVGVRAVSFFSVAYLSAGGLDHRLDDLLVGLQPVGRDSSTSRRPRSGRAPRSTPMWSAHEVEIGRITPAKPSASSFFWSSARFSRPQRTCSPVIDLALAVALLRAPDAFDAEHLDHHAARVQHRCRPRPSGPCPGPCSWTNFRTSLMHLRRSARRRAAAPARCSPWRRRRRP